MQYNILEVSVLGVLYQYTELLVTYVKGAARLMEILRETERISVPQFWTCDDGKQTKEIR